MTDIEQITDPVRMAKLLERLARQHALLTVRIPGHSELYTSCIVDVDRPYILLDELLPSTGHQLLIAERKLQVTGKLDGIEIRFDTTLEHFDNRDNLITYHANLPGHLEYRQRRLDYRAHIPMAQTLRVVIDTLDGDAIEGKLHDLSHGGAGVIYTDAIPAVERGHTYQCAIELPDATWLFCTVELRYSKSVSARDRHLIGARFADLSPAQARLVGHCINQLQLEFIRKRTAD